MKILFYFGHPAQYLFAKETIKELIKKKHTVKITIKTKDVLEDLVKSDGLEYENILPRERGKSKSAIIWSLLKRLFFLSGIILKFKPDLLVSGDPSIAQLGKLFHINRITVTDDDYEVIKKLADITNPFTQTILCPTVCSVGKWEYKKIGYEGYMKLAYLHPNRFRPQMEKIKKYGVKDKYVIIRIAKLTAHHDFGISGIDNSLLDEIIDILEEHSFQVLLSVEGEIASAYDQYLLKINPNDMHHILAYATLLISDSQSMSVEAAILGTPSLRVSDFAGKISVLEELEHKYRLTFGFLPKNKRALMHKLNELLSIENLKEEFHLRKAAMLEDKIDVAAFLTWFLENYPESKSVMQQDPKFQLRFR